MELFLSPPILEVGLRVFVLCRPGGKIYLLSGQKKSVGLIGFLNVLLEKWGRVCILMFEKILG